MKFAIRCWLCLFGAMVCLASGCSERGPQTVPVYGTVTFVGREDPKVCRIFFQPIKVNGLVRPCVAERGADGNYKAKAFKDSKGLVPGTYRVQVTYYDLKPGANPNIEASWIPTNYVGGEIKVDADSSGVEHNVEVPTKK